MHTLSLQRSTTNESHKQVDAYLQDLIESTSVRFDMDHTAEESLVVEKMNRYLKSYICNFEFCQCLRLLLWIQGWEWCVKQFQLNSHLGMLDAKDTSSDMKTFFIKIIGTLAFKGQH